MAWCLVKKAQGKFYFYLLTGHLFSLVQKAKSVLISVIISLTGFLNTRIDLFYRLFYK